MAENETPLDGAAAAVKGPEPVPEALMDWVKETRARTPTPEATPAKPPSDSPRRRRFRALLVGLAILACGWSLYIQMESTIYTSTALQGRLEDPRHQPVVGARVFLVADPTIETTTDGNGCFRLPQTPLGRQALVAVLEDVGEEYAVKAVGATVSDVGTLVYRVPPQSVRRAPGGGYGWTGLEADEPVR